MQIYLRRSILIGGMLALTFSVGTKLTRGQSQGQRVLPAVDPKVRTDDPILGTWIFDASRSYFNRDGKSHGTTEGQSDLQAQFGGRPTGPLGGVGKWVIASERDGLTFKYYKGTTADATELVRTFFCTLDGKPYPDPNGPGKDEVGRYWRLHPLMIAREVTGKDGHVAEMVALALSTDGQVLTVSSWLPETPNLQNMQVFTKVTK
jgi:hypothetical protein